MVKLEYFFLTEVKGQEISSVENLANWFLRPAQFFWGGKKIDLIREGDNIALQSKSIYPNLEYSYLMTIAMIIILVPSLILGSILKIFPHLCYNDSKVISTTHNMLQNMGSIFIPENQEQFGRRIQILITALHQINEEKKDDPISIFLSEIESIPQVPETITHPLKYGVLVRSLDVTHFVHPDNIPNTPQKITKALEENHALFWNVKEA